jgi:hypothetical protein
MSEGSSRRRTSSRSSGLRHADRRRALQITNATGTPYYGAFTGAGLLRKTPPDSSVVNYRASYAEETRAMVDA